MTTYIAWTALRFCLVVCALALAVRCVRRLHQPVRRTATRIAVTFGVLALAAGYVWFEVGPEVDQRLAAEANPQIVKPPPREQDI